MTGADRSETTRFRDLLTELGSNDARSGYYAGSYWRNSVTKQRDRERVLDFMLASIEPTARIKLLSLPGLSWVFENMLLSEPDRLRSHLVCLESSASLYHRTKRLIPGRIKSHVYSHTGLRERLYDYGRATIPYCQVRSHYISDRVTGKKIWISNKLLLLSASDYTSMLLTDYGATYRERLGFHRRFYQRNAAWLDFTAPLGGEVDKTIRNVLFALENHRPITKPVVITVLNGRDDFHGEDERIEHVKALQPALQYCDHWTYTGKGGVSMLTMCFAEITEAKSN